MKHAAFTILGCVDFPNFPLTGCSRRIGPRKLGEIILGLASREVAAKGRQIPFRLLLSTDVYDDIKAKCEQRMKLLRESGAAIRGIGHERLVEMKERHLFSKLNVRSVLSFWQREALVLQVQHVLKAGMPLINGHSYRQQID